MEIDELLKYLDETELTYEATALVGWQIGAASDAEEVASFMVKGGPLPPRMSAGQAPVEDKRPDKSLWEIVKKEMHAFICTEDKRYKKLWADIMSLKKKSSHTIVALIAAAMGQSLGIAATIVSGFVAVCLYAILKIGKETYCTYSGQAKA